MASSGTALDPVFPSSRSHSGRNRRTVVTLGAYDAPVVENADEELPGSEHVFHDLDHGGGFLARSASQPPAETAAVSENHATENRASQLFCSLSGPAVFESNQ